MTEPQSESHDKWRCRSKPSRWKPPGAVYARTASTESDADSKH